MPDVPTRRKYLAVLAGSATALAGCSTGDSSPETSSADRTEATRTPSDTSGNDTPEPEDDGEDTPSLTEGTIAEQSLPPVAGLIPDVDPLVVSAWNTGGGGIQISDSPDTPTDTLRFNAAAGALTQRVMASYLLTSQEGAFASEVWAGQLDAGNEPDWATVVADVGVMYGSGIELPAVRDSLSATEMEYETIVDESDRLVVRGPLGDVVGATSNLVSFMPASQGSFPFSPVDRLRALVETAVGDRTPLPEADSSLRRALRRAPLSGVAHVIHSKENSLSDALDTRYEKNIPGFTITGAADGYSDARTAISHIDLGGDDQPSPATGTIAYDETAAIEEESLVTNVGTLGNEREYIRDGSIVQIRCEYTTDALTPFRGSGTVN